MPWAETRAAAEAAAKRRFDMEDISGHSDQQISCIDFYRYTNLVGDEREKESGNFFLLKMKERNVILS